MFLEQLAWRCSLLRGCLGMFRKQNPLLRVTLSHVEALRKVLPYFDFETVYSHVSNTVHDFTTQTS